MGKSYRLGIAIITVAVVIILLIAAGVLLKSNQTDEMKLPLLALIGVVVLLGVLALISYTFTIFDLADKTQALALPEGSIRAVFAIILLVLFAAIPLFLYGTLPGGVQKLEDLSLEEKNALHTEIIHVTTNAVVVNNPKAPTNAPASSTNYTYTVWFKDTSPGKEDFAKQLLTTISTLVTSVAGFYFGAGFVKSAQSAAGTPTSPAPTLKAIQPRAAKKEDRTVSLQILGSNLEQTKVVKLTRDGKEIVGTDVTSQQNMVGAKFAFDDSAAGQPWTVVVIASDGRTAELPNAFTVT